MAYTDEFGNIYADDDSGNKDSQSSNDGTSSSANTQTYYENDGTSSTSNGAQVSGNAGTTVPGKPGDTSSADDLKKPGRRLYNPLGNYSSYTYQLTLYMITPDAYNAFITSGRKNINAFSNTGSDRAAADYASKSSGVYVIAQSGGVNNKNQNRAPGFELDYYIDNLEIHTTVGMGKATLTDGPTNTITAKFQIIEPYGFSFISKLKTAANAITQYVSSLPNVGKNPFADRQTYILGIKFLGYDKNGELINGSEGNFQTFFDLKIQNITFKLDGKATVYNVDTAGAAITEGMGLKNGRILSDTTVVGSTVDEMIQSLFDNVNKYQKDVAGTNGIEIPNQYEKVYVGDDKDLLSGASVANNDVDSDKKKLPVSEKPTTTDSINTKDAISATPDSTKRTLVFKGQGATSILDAIQSIIKQSDYLRKPIKDVYKNETEPNRKGKDYDMANDDSKQILKWINVSNEITNLGYDTLRKDWAYKIKYIISSYEAPAVNVVQAGTLPKYYGPSKRYSYYLTGKNSEILRFELAYNSLYSTIAVGNLLGQKNIQTPIPTMIGHRVDEQRQGGTGVYLESQNAFTNYMNDPGSYASAKVTILGDPDWLMQTDNTSINSIYSRFYGIDGYTINPNSGQVFIEIDFKEAIDYDNTKGVMSVNDKILFWDYPQEYKTGKNKIQGIAFSVQTVTHTFRNGKFEQTLDLVGDFWPKSTTSDTATTDQAAGRAIEEGAQIAANARKQAAATDPRLGNINSGTGQSINNIGFTKAPANPVQEQTSASSPTSNPPANTTNNTPSTLTNTQVTAPTGGSGNNVSVADDDAASMAAAFSNNPTPATGLNNNDGGRESPTSTDWTTTWV